MPKAYWIATYRAISDPTVLAKYAEKAGPAIQAFGGRFLARGTAAFTFEGGSNQRTVLIEFESADQAAACYRSAAYEAAHAVLDGSVEREIRIVEGVPPA